VSAFADEIGDNPVHLPLLNPLLYGQLAPSKPAAEQHRQHRVIAELALVAGVRRVSSRPPYSNVSQFPSDPRDVARLSRAGCRPRARD
jgi:hypothetical protein